MKSRREFLKKATLLAGATGMAGAIPESVLKAMSIDPAENTSFYDAEHVVFLMQENRSFDHFFGKMKGVRGFNDPHPHIQPNGNKVWLQSDNAGHTYAPFRVDINKTKITWQGGLPHTWNDQVAARNDGKYDKWLPVKTPMTLAHYEREDIPFYYALGDAFTVCDQHFCSSLTGTTPNRLFFFTGTIRGEKSENEIAIVDNHQADSRNNTFVDWPTFQETLEDNGVDWRVYQNEVWTSGLDEEIDDWLGNYGDNPLEYISRHHVKLSAYFRKNGDKTSNPPLTAEEVTAKYNQLSQKEKNLIDKAFTTNINLDKYLELERFSFTNDQGKTETINIPKEDIFHQFRKDVNEDKLPTVSWLIAPKKFSDHTSSPLYGTWYVSEALDILTKNPEIWKKTIFVLTYDENDGYFDHHPPFVVPNPKDATSGKISDEINYATDFEIGKNSPIGLGYRVPMIIASPWSKGGFVNSQVFDHTSSIMFIEQWLNKKTKRNIKSNNISEWRRAVCGDLTSAFRPYSQEKSLSPEALKREVVITNITKARNKPAQTGPTSLNAEEIEKINKFESFADRQSKLLPQQERGIKKACALPYHLNVDMSWDDNELELSFESVKTLFGNITTSLGAPFTMITINEYKKVKAKTWAYTANGGDTLKDKLNISDFENELYDLNITGPNGFFRQFKGDKENPKINIKAYADQHGILFKKLNGNLVFEIENTGIEVVNLLFTDNKYKADFKRVIVKPKTKTKVIFELKKNGNWYDWSLTAEGKKNFTHRYAGKIETGDITITDPYMAGVV